MERKYRVSFYQDNWYEVINTDSDNSEFKGTLADCEAYIKLRENGYL